MWGTLKEHVGNIEGTCREHGRNIIREVLRNIIGEP
jgi:hypothetical protein